MKGAERDARDPTRIVEAHFVAAAAPGAALPAASRPEIAFAGRSNVGKSSLINALVERKSLVRTSSTPGSTRQINLFEARAADGVTFQLVDLPGYGFTKRSKAERASWGELIEGYLTGRSTLAVIVLLVDLRRGLEEDDRDLVAFVDAARAQRALAGASETHVVLVATKIDKLPSSARTAALAKLSRDEGRKVIGTSAVTSVGKREIWVTLRRLSESDKTVDEGGPAPFA